MARDVGLTDMAAERRVSAAGWNDFFPQRVAKLVGDTQLVVRFGDECTEVLITADRPATKHETGCRAGCVVKLCLCELAQEDCASCGRFYRADNDERIRSGNADRPMKGDVRDAADGDVSGDAVLDDSEATVDLSAIADALVGPLGVGCCGLR